MVLPSARMFNHAVAGALTLPQHLSSDHDPLFEFHRWKANLRILDVTEIKTVPTCLYRIRSLSD
jgi:putative transposase